MRISYTKLQTFLQCPLKYRYRYIDRRPEKKPWPFRVLGSAVHAALADFARLPGEPTRIVLEDLLRHHWRRQDRGCFTSGEEEAEWGRKGLKMLAHFLDSENKIAPAWLVDFWGWPVVP